MANPLSTSLPLAACLLCAALPTAQAVTTRWIAPDGGTWEDAAHWSDGVPGAADLAIVAPPTRPSGGMTLNVATTLAGLQLANTNLNVRADLTVTGAVAWDERGDRPGILTFSNGPTLRWQGPVALTGSGWKAINLTGVLDLAGPTTWGDNVLAGGNALTIGINSANSVLRNRGVFTDANAFDTTLAGRGTFDNQGHFVKTGAAVTQIDLAGFRNSGTVDVAAGTLRLTTSTGVHSGSWIVDAGAVLDFAGGTHTLAGPLGGAGTLRLSGGSVEIEGFGHNVHLLLDGGALAGSNAVIDGPLTWRSGTIAGNGATLFTGSVSLEGSALKNIGAGRQLTSYGLTTWTGGDLNIGTDAALATTFTNVGEFRDADASNQRLGGLAPELSRFVNAGQYVKTGGGFTFVSQLAFDNQGTIDVRAGLLRFNSALTNGGVVRVAAGAGLTDISGSALHNHGTLTGDGEITATWIYNHGLVSPGDTIGTLSVNFMTLAADGTLKLELGAGGAHDLLSSFGTLELGGALDLWNTGYAPAVGDSFALLAFANRQGVSGFDAVRTHGFAPGFAFDLVYGEQDVRLLVTAVPEPAAPALWLAGLALTAAAWRRRAVQPA